ncbi:MAG TPA: long-chain fatty acid--CoA ligase [Candidatus Bathyarchaeia archaeon]|nr:long-chain fatty acid--CoA ligase [Candidatus Bathyarchaeia archaeon]
MSHGEESSLWRRLSAAGRLSERALHGAAGSVTLGEMAGGSSLGGRLEALRGRSVLLATSDHLTAALALIELDSVAHRLVLATPDLPAEHVPLVMAAARVDAVVSDHAWSGVPAPPVVVTCSAQITPAAVDRTGRHPTEWILLTSGTTGLPKLVVHTLATLTGAIKGGGALASPAVWSTFYDIRRYGGLQIFLRALLGGGSMVLSSAAESTGDFLTRAGARGVSHISGTPSHWRRALMSPLAGRISPRYVRLSGEIADQAILDHLRAAYPGAGVAHAFASTEAGVAFDVGDGLAGFPPSLVGGRGTDVEMKVEDGSLRIRSNRTALRYLGNESEPLRAPDGFVDTGDMVELRGDRYHFVGRRGGIINVGGRKVHPEEVEAVINRHPGVQMSLVRARRSPITGAVVVAEVVLRGTAMGTEAIEQEILAACRSALAPHKVPASIRFVPSLDVAASGKLARLHA